MTKFDSSKVRSDFPALSHTINGKPVVYLDTAASAQKPRAVIDAMNNVMESHYANIHRGLYEFSRKTTLAYETAREKVAAFIGAEDRDIVFTRGTTEGINLVAATWGSANISAGDEILITHLEHHANIVPWQLLAKEKGATLKVCPITDRGEIDFDAFKAMLSPKVKLAAFSHMSNALGTISPIAEMIAEAKKHGTKTLIDGAQAVLHIPVDVKALDCDFYVFSGHKLYGPTGIGVLYGRHELLNTMPPYQSGGDMIETVSFDKGTTFKSGPARFEAGTPAIVEAVGLGAAIDYIQSFGLAEIASYEEELYGYALKALSEIGGITVHGKSLRKASIISFTADWGHPADIATLLDKHGISVRVGHHCTMPLMERLGLNGTVRASIGMYNTFDDIDAFIAAVVKVRKLLG